MAYKQVSAEFNTNPVRKFEKVGDLVEGHLTDIREVTTRTGTGFIADFNDLQGDPFSVWLATVLQRLVTPDLIGSQLLITFDGKVKNPDTGRMYNSFTVQVWENDEVGDQAEIPF